ncbi:MAG TPA: lipoprotein [Moraxellaceae bacterium]|nr:lipoprotein [Moraxellaceae bacterium]
MSRLLPLCLFLLLAGCGQKGALYLPQKPGPSVPTPAPSSTANTPAASPSDSGGPAAPATHY